MGRIVAIVALLPPWILIYLVSGRRGLRGIWPLPVVGSLAYIAGQYPTSQWLGPYLPDVIGALVCFGALLLLLKYWKPAETLGYGGVPVSTEAVPAGAVAGGSVGAGSGGPVTTGTGPGEPARAGGGPGGGGGPAGDGRAGGTRDAVGRRPQPRNGRQSGGHAGEAVPGLSRFAS